MKISLVFVTCIFIFLVVHECRAGVLGRDEGQVEEDPVIQDSRERAGVLGRDEGQVEEDPVIQDSREIYMDNERGSRGDMILDDDQLEMIRSSEYDDAELGKRHAHADMSKRWPNGEIPYYVNSDVEGYYGPDIAEAVAEYEQHTCLTFIKHTSPPSGGYVNVKSGAGCSSKVGYKGTNRNLALYMGGCRSVIAHEFGHAIGFKHEHERPDRDSYITVMTENIMIGKENSFNKLSTSIINTYGVPYDYKSVMHYAPFTFSANDKPTIVTKNPMDMIDIGVYYVPSFTDIKLANLMYDCNSACSAKTCNNGGYQDDTCNCVCAPGWTGSDCSTSVALPDDCKNYITSGSGEVTSENYPNNYPKEHTCQWHLKGTAGQTITVTFTDFELEGRDGGVCDDDFLAIRQTELYYGGDKYCGTSAPSTLVVPSSVAPPELLIFFKSDRNSIIKKGFKFTYTIA